MKFLPEQNGPHRIHACDADVLWMLWELSDSGRISRRKLSELVCLGEGTVRSILALLSECGLIDVFQTGVIISPEGKRLISRIAASPVELDAIDSVLGEYQQTVLVKGAAEKITNGNAQRDVGIRMGSLGCTTIVCKDGRLYVPPDYDMVARSPEFCREILQSVPEIEHNDVLIIGDSNDWHSAMVSSVTAALELL